MIKLPRPASVAMYNKFMGGVDKADMFLSLYRSKMRSKKWYHRIAFHLLQLTAVNSYSLYKEIGGNGSYLDFLVDICGSLVAAEDVDRVDREDLPKIEINNRSLKASNVPKSIRYDRIDHWPLQLTKTRCKYPGCNRRTTFKCSKCSVFLCKWIRLFPPVSWSSHYSPRCCSNRFCTTLHHNYVRKCQNK